MASFSFYLMPSTRRTWKSVVRDQSTNQQNQHTYNFMKVSLNLENITQLQSMFYTSLVPNISGLEIKL
jgi:hypothetical protein